MEGRRLLGALSGDALTGGWGVRGGGGAYCGRSLEAPIFH